LRTAAALRAWRTPPGGLPLGRLRRPSSGRGPGSGRALPRHACGLVHSAAAGTPVGTNS